MPIFGQFQRFCFFLKSFKPTTKKGHILNQYDFIQSPQHILSAPLTSYVCVHRSNYVFHYNAKITWKKTV